MWGLVGSIVIGATVLALSENYIRQYFQNKDSYYSNLKENLKRFPKEEESATNNKGILNSSKDFSERIFKKAKNLSQKIK